MFLVDSSIAGADWDGTISVIKTILKKVKAEIISIKKWDDRKLAYNIKGKSRGTYILSYFRVEGEKITDIENAVRLSEKIMRALILNAEHMSQEDIDKETPAMKFEKEEGQGNPEVKVESDSFGSIEAEETAQSSTEMTGTLPISDISAISGINMLVEEVVDNQSEQNQIEDFGQTDGQIQA